MQTLTHRQIKSIKNGTAPSDKANVWELSNWLFNDRQYTVRRYGTSKRFYGERVITGDMRLCLDWLKDVLARRVTQGFKLSRQRKTFLLERGQEQVLFKLERAK